MVGIRKLICNGSNINREVMHHFPQIIKFMEQAEYPQLKLEAVWVTASLASAGVEFCEGIIKNGGVEVLIKLVGESEEKIIDHVLFTLGNLSA
jgi:tRNA isopentenyl-2-thiomethyl-A-37 hydroxylase MiaE